MSRPYHSSWIIVVVIIIIIIIIIWVWINDEELNQGCAFPSRQVARLTTMFLLCPNFVVPRLDLASCHLSGAENFEVVAGFLGSLCTPALNVAIVFNLLCIMGILFWTWHLRDHPDG
jgi:hypothetical protein